MPELSLLRRVCSLTLALVVVTAMVLPALQSPAPPRGVGQCSREALSTRPGWTNSAVWANGGRELLVVDNAYRRILRYSEKGRSLGTIPKNVGAALGEHSPHILQTKDTGFVMELSNERMVTLDRSFVPVQAIDLKEGRKDDRRIDSIFHWTVAGGDLVMLSDLFYGGSRENQWISAFIRFPLATPGKFTEVLRLDSSEARVFYRLGHPYITSIGDTAYLLLMDETMTLVRIQKGRNAPQQLKISGLALGKTPQLPGFRVYVDFEPLMKAVEKSTMPVGLFGWEGFLYMLSRKPAQGVTEWKITKIDPQKGELAGTAVLRTHANHLTVAPGPYKWAFLEKGPVRGLIQQEIKTVLFVPSSKFRATRLRGNVCE